MFVSLTLLTMSDKMSDSVFAKLSAAEADLAAQEAKLAEQLGAIQAKRASLQSVLEIFDSNKSTMATETASDMNAARSVGAIANLAVDSPMEALPKPSRQRQATQKKTKSTRSQKAASGPKSNPRGWREYVRDEYRQKPLPVVVAGILQGHPKKVFEIAEMVDTIFVQTIPKAARKGARERVSNILAEGARKNQWQRGQSGCYSFSK